jgi:hypothetical protein
MGNAVKSFVIGVGKMAAKGAVSGTIGAIPLIGGPLASFINSKFSKGSKNLTFADGTIGIKVPEGVEKKIISTPTQLISLVKANPEEASKAGLTVDMIKEGVQEAKAQVKAVGGLIKKKVLQPVNPIVAKAYAKGGKVRSPAQLEATRKLVEANRKRLGKK